MFSFCVLFCFFLCFCFLFYFGYKISERNKLTLHTRTAYFAPPCYLNHKQKKNSFMKTCGHNILFLLTCKYDLCTIMKKIPPKKSIFLGTSSPIYIFWGFFLCVFVKKNVAFEQQSSENAVKHKNLTFLKMSPIHIHLISSSYNFF